MWSQGWMEGTLSQHGQYTRIRKSLVNLRDTSSRMAPYSGSQSDYLHRAQQKEDAPLCITR